MLNEKNGTTHGAFPTTLIFRRNRREHPVLLSRASYPPIGCDSRTLQQIRTSQTYQNFPTRPPPSNESEPNFRSCNGGGLVGKFGEGQGGLEGRETPPKGVSLRLQGLPYPSLHLLRESLYLRGALGIQSRADANNRIGKGQVFAVFQ